MCRNTVSAKLRLNSTVSPNLSFEGYAEPFVSSGGYASMSELSAPRSRDLRVYGTDGTTVSIDSLGVRTAGDSFLSVKLRYWLPVRLGGSQG